MIPSPHPAADLAWLLALAIPLGFAWLAIRPRRGGPDIDGDRDAD